MEAVATISDFASGAMYFPLTGFVAPAGAAFHESAVGGEVGINLNKAKDFIQDVKVQLSQEVEDFENKVLPKPFAGSSGP